MDFSTDGRYVAYGGQTRPAGASPITILGIYDLARRQRVQQDSIVCKDCSDGELRHLSISSDGNRIIAGDWGQRVHYYVRSDTTSRWQRVQSLDVGSRVYWTDMSADNSVAVVGMQGTDVRLYSLGTSSLSLLWRRPDPGGQPLDPPMDGGARQVSITPDGSYITAGTRGGGAGGGQLYVFSRSGTVLFSRRTAASQSGSTYVGPNGADPEVWFTRVSADGSKAVYAGFSGAAYFLRTQ